MCSQLLEEVGEEEKCIVDFLKPENHASKKYRLPFKMKFKFTWEWETGALNLNQPKENDNQLL